MSSLTTDRKLRSSGKAPVWRRLADPKILVLIVGFMVVWLLASLVTEPYNVPRIGDVVKAMVTTVTTPDELENLLTTLARVGVGLLVSFAAGLGIGLVAGAAPGLGGYLLPAVRFVQGIPSLSWVIMAVIWFANVESRVLFVMVLVTLPGFALQTYDSYRAVPPELRDMARSFRPTGWLMFREVTMPSIAPGIFTAWKVNLGLGIRMVLIAELVGATVGVGSQLLSAQQLFDMASVVSWTLLLAVCMLILQALIDALEGYVLRYRASAQPAASKPAPPVPAAVKG
jgi:NitT/TauT family transport system permease protein